MDVDRFPEWYKAYCWEGRSHALFGYPPDQYPAFEWISSLEKRFLHYRQHPDPAPLFLVREMIQWGGNQNGVLDKFDMDLGSYCLHKKLDAVRRNIQSPQDAIRAALDIPGLGLTYASKLLRFLDPERYGALDGRIRKSLSKLSPPQLPKIHDSDVGSMTRGYCEFSKYLEHLRRELLKRGISLPAGFGGQRSWRAADIEMALFHWALSDGKVAAESEHDRTF